MIKIGIIGGSGLENIANLSYCGEESVNNIYGIPSDSYKIYKSDNTIIYSLSRHGATHQLAPSKINYKANIYGFKMLEVSEILAFSSVGGINDNYKSGDLVLTSDAIDNTNRVSSFYDKIGEVIHIDMSMPFCKAVRKKLKESANICHINLIDKGVYICTEGPRFETPAEIKMYKIWGADMVGMTLFPEISLSKELGICYANISLITNMASGVEKDKKLTSSEVIEEAKKNTYKISKLIEQYITYNEENNEKYSCQCKDILNGAKIS